MKFKSIIIAAALSAAPAFAQDDQGLAGEWRGFLLRDGVRAPMTVVLSDNSDSWAGTYRVGGISKPLDHLRVSGGSVHFELSGEAVFDGTVAGDTLAGAVSGGASQGSFELRHQEEDDAIESSGP